MRSTTILAVLLVAFAAACAPKPAPVEPTPVSVEPTYTGKYK
ncbi:MAG: hypothetical protein ACRC14_09165 [Paracoccaceae bacterium]